MRKIQERNSDQEQDHAEEPTTEPETLFEDGTDICQQLMDRYAKSAAPQHRHLLATAAAMRSILSSESLPLTAPAYFAAAINALDSQTLDTTATASLLTFLSIVVPLVQARGIAADKASDAVGVLVRLVEREGLGAASLRGLVKCLGVLLVGFCDLEDWDSIKLGLETLLKFSLDKRPKVRKCAQDYLESIFQNFHSSNVIKKASKLVFSLLKSYMPVAVSLSTLKTVDGSKSEILSKPEHIEVLHILNVLKLTFPHLSIKVSPKVLPELCKLMNSEFSPITRHILNIIQASFETSRLEAVISEIDNIITSLASFVSLGEKKPNDTVVSAATLLKSALDKLHAKKSRSWMKNFSMIFNSLAGLLTCEANIASQASCIMKELINDYVVPSSLSVGEDLSFEDEIQESDKEFAIKSTCSIVERTLSSCNGTPNEYILAVISFLFHKLGDGSYIFMSSIVLKLAEAMTLAGKNISNKKHVQNCVGSAVIAMGPEKMLTLLPISLNSDDFCCSNIWIVPILKSYVVGASLGYYMEHIVPLAKSFQRASHRVKKTVISQDLQAHAHDLRGLLPAFCRYPTDIQQNVGSLVKHLNSLLKDSSMHENTALALQVIVSQNKFILNTKGDSGDSNPFPVIDAVTGWRSPASYSKKTATKNIKALASCSTELLQALMDLFVDSPAEKRTHLKDAIRYLASITDSSITKTIYMSMLKRFQFLNDEGEFCKVESHTPLLIDQEQGNLSTVDENMKRCVLMELASSLVEGAKEDLVNFIFNFIVHGFQETGIGYREGYHTLSRILEEHFRFCSSRLVELVELLLGLKPPADDDSLRSRFACFHILMVQSLQSTFEGDEENTKAFLILNEIILKLKDAKEEGRKVAYDVLLRISSSVRNLSCTNADAPYHKLINMIMGYLSGSSPHIKSGAVSALSVMVYKDTDVCLSMPDLVSSLLSLLQSKALEVIKAVLGFVKVLVSSMQATHLQNLLSDIVNAVLPWSPVSRNHFRSKVTIILEILIRKCGSASVQMVTPEKHKGFIKTVLQNRHNKKEAGVTDVETALPEISTNRPHKRKHKEDKLPPEANGSMELKKRKREKQQDVSATKSNEMHVSSATGGGGSKWAKRARHSNREKSINGESEGGQKYTKGGNADKGFSGGGKGKIKRTRLSKKNGGGPYKHANASKSVKHKMGKKPKKIKK